MINDFDTQIQCEEIYDGISQEEIDEILAEEYKELWENQQIELAEEEAKFVRYFPKRVEDGSIF